MWKFIITWCLATAITDPCPDAEKIDEFGRRSIHICGVYHYHLEYDCGYYKEFFDRDVAVDFYDKAIKEASIWSQQKIDSVKIDSVKINID